MSDENSRKTMIRDTSAHRNFTMVPNIIIDGKLSHSAFHLYIWYKKVCSMKPSGQCYQSLQTIGKSCNMSKSTITKARRELKENGLIEEIKDVQPDGHARITVTISDVWNINNRWGDPGVEGIGTQCTDSRPCRKFIIALYKKYDCSVRNRACNKITKKEEEEDVSGLGNPDGPRSFDGSDEAKRRKASTVPAKFDHRVVKELYRVIATKIKVNSQADRKKWADQIRLMRTKDKVSKQDIRRAVQWYAEHIHDDYAVEAYSAEAFRKKYSNGKIPGAMARGGGARRAGGVDLDAVRSRLFGEHDFQTPTQGLLDEVLVGMGHAPGSVKAHQV